MANALHIAKLTPTVPKLEPHFIHNRLRYPEPTRLLLLPSRKMLSIELRVRPSKSPPRNFKQKVPQKQFHLWKRKSLSGVSQKARSLADTVMRLPNDKQSVYGALNQWVAWEEEFPLIAFSKALGILKKRNQWQRIIQVTKWMFSKGQGMTMGTYDALIFAFDMEGRVDEAQAFWDMISLKHLSSMPKKLFSRIISMYERHNRPEKVLEIFADMEELGVRPDESTLKKVSYALSRMGFDNKRDKVLRKYKPKWKYLHFNGEQIRVRVEDLKNMPIH